MEKGVLDKLVGLETEKFKEANISLILQNYEEIFSQFDPRPYLERSISEDFLRECKRAVRAKREEGIELRILIPKKERNIREEWRIKKRLKEHFGLHYAEERKEIKQLVKEGVTWFFFGTVFIMLASWIHISYAQSFWTTLATTMLEPAGWFSFWEGLVKVIITPKEKSENYKFYKRMSEVEINFAEF